MKIIMYKFRPIIIAGLQLTLECVATIFMDWGSCPTGGTIVDGKFWYTTTLEGDPDEMYIVLWEDDVNYPDYPTMMYLEVQTPPTDLSAWYEPQQIFKTFVLDDVSITVGVWLYNDLADDNEKYSFRIFNGTTLVYSDDSLSIGVNGWASLNQDFMWISEAGVINVLYSFQENAYVYATRKAYYYNYQSTDGGLTWTSYLIHSHTNTWNSGYSEEFLYITGEGDTLYAELGRKILYKSIDGGHNWTFVRNDLFPDDYGDSYLAHLFLFKGNLYKCVINDDGDSYGVQKSADGGATFTLHEIIAEYPGTSDFVIVGDYVYMAMLVVSTLYYYRSANGEDWELVSTFTPSGYIRWDTPSFLTVSGDLIAFTTYYMAHKPGGGSTGIAARSMIISRDGGLTWEILTTGFAASSYPRGYVKLTWDAPAGSQVEIYRRYHFPDWSGDWTLIDTVSATRSPYTDISSWCEYPYDYKLKIVGGAESGTAFLHTMDALHYYVNNQILTNGGSVYSVSWLKFVSSLHYPGTSFTSDHPTMLLILQDSVEYENIVYHVHQGSVFPVLQFNPTVMMMVGYLPWLVSIYWLIDGNWQISEIPLRSVFSYYNYYVVHNFTARANGEAVVVLGCAQVVTPVTCYLDVYYTSDFGQSWTGPIPIYTETITSQTLRGDVFKTDDAYYVLFWNAAHTFGSGYKSIDGITWASTIYFYSYYAALATDNTNCYVAVLSAGNVMLFKEVAGTSCQQTNMHQSVHGLKVSPTYASDTTVLGGFAGTMRKTLDGGDTWIDINTGIGNLQIISIGMSNNYSSDQTAFAVPAGYYWIAKTVNGGTSWTQYSSGLSGYSYTKIAVSPNFASDNTVFASSTAYNRHIVKSTDGGVTWSRSDTGMPPSADYMYTLDISPAFASDGTLFSGGAMAPTTAAMYRTTDGGANWTLKNSGLGTGGYIRSLKISPNYASDHTVYCGKDTTFGLYKSTDHGDNWSLIYTFPSNVTSIEMSPNFATDNTMYVTTEHYTWKSTDAGNSWSIIFIGISCGCGNLSAAPSAPIFHGTSLGVFKYTGDVGVGYELINAAISGLSSVYSMCVIGDHICVAGVYLGQNVILHSSDGGLNFSSTSLLHVNLSYYAEFSVDGSNITYGGRGVYHFDTGVYFPGYAISHDYGATWEEVAIEYTHPHDEDEHLIEKLYYS